MGGVRATTSVDEGEQPRLTVHFDSAEALEETYRQSLQQERLFLHEVDASQLAERQRCRVVFVHPDNRQSLDLDGEIVWARAEPPNQGVGIQLDALDETTAKQLQLFVEARGAGGDDAKSSANPHERVRHLAPQEQRKLAMRGTQPERVALERRFGKAVWDALLKNKSLTPPEVAKIARNGKLPQPLMDRIVANGAWLQQPQVRRALLGNPRLRGQALNKVLRATPRAELQRMPQQSAYPRHVREAAKRVLGRG